MADSSSAAEQTVDIVIVGAGLVGTPLASVLSAQGWSVALLDAKPSGLKTSVKTDKRHNSALSNKGSLGNNTMSERCTALSLGTSQWLKSQQLWQEVAVDACRIQEVHVSHKGYFGSTRLRAAELDADAVGYVVNNEHTTEAFTRQLTRTSVKHITGARVNSVYQGDDFVRVHCTDASLRARLLIAADGVTSTIRESVGISTRQVDYDQTAFLGTVELSRAHDNIAYERFTSSGPLAFLPRHSNTMSFVDCINPDNRQAIESLTDTDYLKCLQERFGYRLGRLKSIGPKISVPLVRIEATAQTAHRTVLLGNAMRLLHPVGGQGYNLAMRDVAQLCKVLHLPDKLASAEMDPGNSELLAQYVESRQRDQKQVVTFTDTLARGFRGQASLPAHVRSLGLMALDSMPPLRKQFARRTMGLS